MVASLANWRTIRLGYSNNIFPYLYQNRVTGALNGIYYEIWKLVGNKMLKKKLEVYRKSAYEYLSTKNNGFSGLLGDIYNNTIDASLEDFNYRSDRMRHFYTTSPVDYTTNDFYLRDSNVNLGRIETYIVFPPFTLFLLFASLISVVLTERVVFVCRMRAKNKYKSAIRRKFGTPIVQNTVSMILPHLRQDNEKQEKGRQRWKSLQWEVTSGLFRTRIEEMKRENSMRACIASFLYDLFYLSPSWSHSLLSSFPFNRPISHFLYIFATMMIGQIYGAQFAGNSFTPTAVSGTDLFEMTESLRVGSNQLLVQDTNFLMDDFYNEVYPAGNITGRVLVQPDMNDFKGQICKTGSLFGYVTSYQMTTKDPTDPYRAPCQFIKVDSVSGLHRFPPSSNMSKQNFGTEEPIAFYIGRRHKGKKMREAVDQVILRLFDDEKIQNFWWRRFTGKERNPVIKPPKFSFEQMQMKDFQLVLLLLAVIYSLAGLVFAGEIAYHRYHRSALKDRVNFAFSTTAAKISVIKAAKLPFVPKKDSGMFRDSTTS